MDKKTMIYYSPYSLLAGGSSIDIGVRRPANKQIFVRRVSWSILVSDPLNAKTNPHDSACTLEAGLRFPMSPNVVDENGGAMNQGYFQIEMTRQHTGQMEFDNFPVDNGTFTVDVNNADAVTTIDFTLYIMIEFEFK